MLETIFLFLQYLMPQSTDRLVIHWQWRGLVVPKVALRRVRLVLGWVTICRRVNHLRI